MAGSRCWASVLWRLFDNFEAAALADADTG